MPGLLPDINLQGHFQRATFMLHNRLWVAMWNDLDITVHTFAELGLKLLESMERIDSLRGAGRVYLP